MKKTELQILSDWINETPQMTRALLKDKIILIQFTSKQERKSKTIITENSIFIKPTIPEVMDYCVERNNTINAQHFYDYYESKGWVIGKVKMKSWKASVRTWENNKTNNLKNGNDNLQRVNRQSFEEIRQNSTGWSIS